MINCGDLEFLLYYNCFVNNETVRDKKNNSEDDKIALETHRVTYTQTVDNHLSTESRVPKIGTSHTLAKLPKTLQILFSLNSNFGIGGSSAKAPPPIHRGRVRLLALT
ncbi:hypothetical protein DVH24_006864 [Malus domestica]|uniref:Uncharacterized protein n=1 Tax=Malus domestica TaxID=3750 RepID=A0A498J564_MALDO|nr:hypothetical protein DVH24_006864 [Malus domestica]